MPLGCLAASLRLHVASLAVLFHHGCACLSVSQSSGSGRKLYQPSFFFFSFFLFSRCDFLLPQGRLVIRLRAPPTWRLPTPSILSSQITPATASEKSSYLEAANVINPQQPDHTSHRVCEFLLPGGCRRHPSRAARSHQPLCLEPLPFPELEPDGCLRPLPFPGHEPGGCLEPLPFPKLNPEDVLNLCPSQSLNPKGALNLCPSQSWNPPVVTVSGTSKSRRRPYWSPPMSTLYNYYWSS